MTTTNPILTLASLSPAFVNAMATWSQVSRKGTQWHLQLDREGPDTTAPWVTVCEDGTPFVTAVYGPSTGLSDCPRGPLGFSLSERDGQFHVEALHGDPPTRTFATAQAAFDAIIPPR